LARPDPACGLGGRVGFEEGAFEAGGEDLAGGGGAGYAGADDSYAFFWSLGCNSGSLLFSDLFRSVSGGLDSRMIISMFRRRVEHH
jgi:hypothetical protein